MARYVTLRALQAVGVLWAAFTISFVVLYLLPADPVSIAADSGGSGTAVDKAAIAELQARYGLDRPLWEQYWTALTNAVQGDLGHSISTGRPVTNAIGDALPATDIFKRSEDRVVRDAVAGQQRLRLALDLGQGERRCSVETYSSFSRSASLCAWAKTSRVVRAIPV